MNASEAKTNADFFDNLKAAGFVFGGLLFLFLCGWISIQSDRAHTTIAATEPAGRLLSTQYFPENSPSTGGVAIGGGGPLFIVGDGKQTPAQTAIRTDKGFYVVLGALNGAFGPELELRIAQDKTRFLCTVGRENPCFELQDSTASVHVNN